MKTAVTVAFLLALGVQSSSAADGGCAPTAGPTDVVPNPMPATPWKGGAVGDPAAPACGEASNAGTPPAGTPTEPIDIPPNPEPRKEPVIIPPPAAESSQGVVRASPTPKTKVSKLPRAVKKAVKTRPKKRLKRARKR